MEFTKKNIEKNDSITKTKFPPMSKASSSINVASLKTNGNVESAQSKIPKRDSFNLSSPNESSVSRNYTKLGKPSPLDNKKPSTSMISLSKQSFVSRNKAKLGKPKPLDTKKPSTSMISLRLPKTSSLASSRSCINSSRSVKSREPTPRSAITEKASEAANKAEKAAAKRNLQSFEIAREKLQSCQEIFMSKYEVVKDELPKENGEFKVVCLFKNNEGHLVTKSPSSKIKTMCDKKTLEEVKTYLKDIVQKKLNSIDDIVLLSKSPRGIGDTFSKDQDTFKEVEEAKRKLKLNMQTFSDEFLKQIENLDTSKEPASNKDFEIQVKSLSDEVNNLKINLESSKDEFTKYKKTNELKCSGLKKELEEKTKIQHKKQMEYDELKKKFEDIEKENLITKTMHGEISEKLNTKIFEWEELTKKLKNCAFNNVNLEAKNKELNLEIKKIENSLNAALKEKEKMLLIEDSIGDQASKYADKVNELKTELLNAKKEKESIEMEVENLKNEIKKLQKAEFQLIECQNEINHRIKENQTLHQAIRDLEGKLQISESQAVVSRDFQEELSKFQRTENLNVEKIKNLEIQLTKAQFNIKKLEDKIAMDAKLLKVRSDLIDSLQNKEQSQKVRLEDLFTEVGEKNNDIQMIKTEILTKTEEFKNLFSTLGTKQMELTRQEHMIKLLQENNERAQNLRVRQEAKIARLEEEILQLKQQIYPDSRNNVILRTLALSAANNSNNDYAESLSFYVEERRRKRQIDISVKKYEK